MSGRGVTVLVVVALVGGLIALEVATGGGGDDESSRRAAPALPKDTLVPPSVTLAALRGKPVVVNFWASWCDPCREEADHLRRFSDKARGRVALVGVSWTDTRAGARKFIREYGWHFPNFFDPGGTVGNRYGLSGLPTTFVLDRDGRIARILRGPQTEATLDDAVRVAEAS
jgi:cytochrome c biogenesis protein CcmG, thiol:disulfide interchange protein DsbE